MVVVGLVQSVSVATAVLICMVLVLSDYWACHVLYALSHTAQFLLLI